MKRLRVIILSVIVLALSIAVTNCNKTCCSPCLEVSVCNTPCPGCKSIEALTWDPIYLFPQVPNSVGDWGNLQAMRPYLFRAWVTNNSSVAVHGVQIVFYWNSWGLSDSVDYGGTPIGSVGIDLAPYESRWVRSPWSFVLNPSDICVNVRIFHPCDKNLMNNFCWMNFHRLLIKYPFQVQEMYRVPFKMDFNTTEGQLDFKIETPKGIDAQIVHRELQQEAKKNVADISETEITNMVVRPGFVDQYTLVIKNVGADFKPGDTFDVTVKAFHKGEMISNFTVKAEIVK